VFCGLVAGGARLDLLRCGARLALGIVAVLAQACVSTSARLYAPRLLEGAPFRVAGLNDLREGMTAAEVRESLGDPLEVAESGEVAMWRYSIRGNPAWCDGGSRAAAPPEYSADAVLVFMGGNLALKTVRQVGPPEGR
jgi:hypothetical protein